MYPTKHAELSTFWAQMQNFQEHVQGSVSRYLSYPAGQLLKRKTVFMKLEVWAHVQPETKDFHLFFVGSC